MYLNYIEHSSLNSAEVNQLKSIAQLCPFTDGVSIYQARALLNLFDTMQYLNSCEGIAEISNERFAKMEQGATENNIWIFPNPACDYLSIFIKQSQSEIVTVEIFNTVGENVLQIKSPVGELIKIPIHTLNQGVYVCKVSSGLSVLKQEKFVITR